MASQVNGTNFQKIINTYSETFEKNSIEQKTSKFTLQGQHYPDSKSCQVHFKISNKKKEKR